MTEFKHLIFTNLGVGIRDELWLLYRVELFLNTALISLAAQHNKEFEWHIFYDEKLPAIFLKRVSDACASSGLSVRLLAVNDYSLINESVRLLLDEHSCPVITTRIDDDDLLHVEAIGLIQSNARPVLDDNGIALISLTDGVEFLPADGLCRPVCYESIALGLSIVDASRGGDRLSVTYFAHHLILKTLKQKYNDARYLPIKYEEPLYLYTKHALSDSYYFGARARVLGDEKTRRLENVSFLNKFGLSSDRLSYLAKLLKQAPLGMPHKYLEKLGDVRKSLKSLSDLDSGDAEELLAKKRRLESRAVRTNPTSDRTKKIRVAILGSCVTRDLFEFQAGALADYEICFYMARSSVISYMSPPVVDPSLTVVGDGFEPVRSRWDLEKKHWLLLERSRPDIVIVDFIDERIGLIRDKGAIVSASGPNIKTFERRGELEIIRPWSSDAVALRSWALPMFMDKLISICQNVFIHKAVWAEKYIANSNVAHSFFGGEFEKLIELNNSILTSMFSQLDEIVAPVEMIGGMEVGLIAGGSHKWSLCPYHYDGGYYKTVAKQLKARVG